MHFKSKAAEFFHHAGVWSEQGASTSQGMEWTPGGAAGFASRLQDNAAVFLPEASLLAIFFCMFTSSGK